MGTLSSNVSRVDNGRGALTDDKESFICHTLNRTEDLGKPMDLIEVAYAVPELLKRFSMARRNCLSASNMSPERTQSTCT